MYQGSFEECLTRGAQKMRENPGRLVLIWKGGDDGMWSVESFPQGNAAAEMVSLDKAVSFIALDHAGMRSLLQWIGDNVLRGSN